MLRPIAWRKLKHAVGPATRVPAQVEQMLTSASAFERDAAYWVLWEALVRRGEWFEASGRAVALLLDSAERVDDPTWLLVLAADIIGADQLRGFVADPDAPPSLAEEAVRAPAIERCSVLFSPKPARARAAAAMALAMLPELRPESVPWLIKQAAEDVDDVARAGALLALGRLGGGAPEALAVLTSAEEKEPSALARGAAAVGRLRLDPKRPVGSSPSGLAAWLGFSSSPELELPWFRTPRWYRTLPFPDATARTLVALGRTRGDGTMASLSETLLGLAATSEFSPIATQIAKIMLDFGGFPNAEPERVPLAEELSTTQAVMAEMLAKTDLLPLGGYGLPASGAVRRRWIGADSPGPLDRRSDLNGNSMPVWRVWPERFPASIDWPSALDRWQALVEFVAGSYPPFWWAMQPKDVEAELMAVPANEALLARATDVANDLGRRFAAAARPGAGAFARFAMSALLLLPLVRGGVPIDPAWDCLIHLGPEPQAREILVAIPSPRREALLLDYLGANQGWGFAASAIAVADLTPKASVFAAIERQLDALASNKFLERQVRKMRAELATITGDSRGPAKKSRAKRKTAKKTRGM